MTTSAVKASEMAIPLSAGSAACLCVRCARLTQFALSALILFASTIGCRSDIPGSYPVEPRPLGTIVDQVNQLQEDNAEPAKLVVYMHEFELNKPEWEHRLALKYEGRPQGFRLTPYGEDHIRRIAAMLSQNPDDPMPVIVERNQTTMRDSTKHKYSVHFGDELDLERRTIVVRSLEALGVYDADSRVIVGPAFSEGLSAREAASAYENNFQQQSNSNSGGGGGGGFGGGAF